MIENNQPIVFNMNSAIVTVFANELNDKPHVHEQLTAHCTDVKKVGGAYSYSPKAGKLFEFLSILKHNRISYGAHFDSKFTADVEGRPGNKHADNKL